MEDKLPSRIVTNFDSETALPKKRVSHVAGIDTLRFVAAFWVLMSHIGGPPLSIGYDPGSKVAWALNGFYGGFFSGPAAVILFFVISGFCIHYPYRTGQKFTVGEFFARRYIRILLPMLAAAMVARLCGVVNPSDDLLSKIPAWSLVAELIYYALYPLLRLLARKVGWLRLTLASFLLALLFSLTAPDGALVYPAWGYMGDWVIGLPCWLMGVLAAENWKPDKTVASVPSRKKIWIFRGVAIVLGAITHNLMLQEIVPEFYTLNFFGIFCYFWFLGEIDYWTQNRPPSGLEALGKVSYSLYLIHMVAAQFLSGLHLPKLGEGFDWMVSMVFVVSFSMALWLIVEYPSHLLARKTGSLVRSWAAARERASIGGQAEKKTRA